VRISENLNISQSLSSDENLMFWGVEGQVPLKLVWEDYEAIFATNMLFCLPLCLCIEMKYLPRDFALI
jgi:hypothetical protein